MITLLIHLALIAALVLNAPDDLVAGVGAREAFWLAGSFGIWRYGWNAIHFVRSCWYRAVTFRSWRGSIERLAANAEAADGDALLPSEVFVIVTSYRIPPRSAAMTFRAAIEEAVRYGRHATLVASVVEVADERMVKRLFHELAPPERVRLVIVRTDGTGKRDALATALRAVARQLPAADAAVVVLDGDTVLPANGLARALPFLKLMPDVAALTTDEDCIVVTRDRLLRSWHRLRFAQRHLLMCSHGLSRRLLTVTGRMAAYRASVATHPDFIAVVRDDALDHWRLGRLPLLTGEDKSTAWWLLRHGLRTVYVPDVKVITIEHPPAPDLPRGSSKLMLRWFGNMLRASGRAIALGPVRLGPFTWWCFVDQRISMWTPLIGPLVVLFAALRGAPELAYAYLVWVMVTRLIQALALLTVRPVIDGTWPMLIYYNQLYGACVKTWILFRLDRQRWTRQNIVLTVPVGPWRRRARAAGSVYLHVLALMTLATAVAFWTGFLTWPRGGWTALPF